MAGDMQEYLVKLGVQLDEQNMEKLEGFMKKSKISALALKDALKAAATAVYTFVKSFVDTEEQLADIAKQQEKTLETVRAEQTALKALGKTLQEVNQDQELRKFYLELVEINKQMALPDVSHVLDAVSGLTNAFAALKSTIQYGLEWIRYYTLDLLKGPMKQFQEYFTKAREWLQLNMRHLAQRTGVVLSDLLKGLSGIVSMGAKLLDYVDQLPDGFKAGIAAVAGFAAALKAGPVGQLLGVVTLIGDLMLDYENYKKNLEQGTNIGVALPGIWQILENDELTGEEKAQQVMGRLTEWITGSAEGVANSISTWLTDNTDVLTNALSGLSTIIQGAVTNGITIADALTDAVEKIIKNPEVINSLGTSFRTLFTTVFGGINDIGGAMVEGIMKALSGMSDEKWEEKFGADGDNDVLGAIGAGLMASMFANAAGMKDQSILIGIAAGIASLIAEAMDDQSMEEALKDESKKGEFQSSFVEGLAILFEGLSGAANTVSVLGNAIAETVVSALGLVTTKEWEAAVGSNNSIVGGLMAGLTAGLTTGNAGFGLAAGILTALTNAFSEGSDGWSNLVDDARGVGGLLWEKMQAGFGNLQEWWDNQGGKEQFQDLADDIEKVLFGEPDENGDFKGGILDVFTQAIEAFRETSLYQSIVSGFETNVLGPIRESIMAIVDEIAYRFIQSLPDPVKEWLGVEDYTIASRNENGEYVYKSINGGTATVSSEVGETLGTRNDILVTKDGKFTAKGAKDVFGSDSGLFSDALTRAVNEGNPAAIRDLLSYLDEYSSGGSMEEALGSPFVTPAQEGLRWYVDRWNKGLIDFSEEPEAAPRTIAMAPGKLTPRELNELYGEEGTTVAETTVTDNGTAEKTQEGIEKVGEAAAQLDGTTAEVTVATKFVTITGANGDTMPEAEWNTWSETQGEQENAYAWRYGKQAIGGRFDRPTYGEFGEDGTEYIIPITKPARAADLILRMFGEMGSAATQRILSELGVGGGAGTIGGGGGMALDAGGLLGGSSTINYHNTVSAPVTITVQPGSASAESVGQTVYSYAERSLLRTVQGVLD